VARQCRAKMIKGMAMIVERLGEVKTIVEVDPGGLFFTRYGDETIAAIKIKPNNGSPANNCRAIAVSGSIRFQLVTHNVISSDVYLPREPSFALSAKPEHTVPGSAILKPGNLILTQERRLLVYGRFGTAAGLINISDGELETGGDNPSLVTCTAWKLVCKRLDDYETIYSFCAR
jgi:hypothetical protein